MLHSFLDNLPRLTLKSRLSCAASPTSHKLPLAANSWCGPQSIASPASLFPLERHSLSIYPFFSSPILSRAEKGPISLFPSRCWRRLPLAASRLPGPRLGSSLRGSMRPYNRSACTGRFSGPSLTTALCVPVRLACVPHRESRSPEQSNLLQYGAAAQRSYIWRPTLSNIIKCH